MAIDHVQEPQLGYPNYYHNPKDTNLVQVYLSLVYNILGRWEISGKFDLETVENFV